MSDELYALRAERDMIGMLITAAGTMRDFHADAMNDWENKIADLRGRLSEVQGRIDMLTPTPRDGYATSGED